MRCVVVVPTYDEAGSIGALLDALGDVRSTLEGTDLDVLVVDDSSPDGTADVVRAHAGAGDWLDLLTRTSKDGLGAAYRTGFAHAVAAGYDVVVQMDADGSHPPSALPALLALLRSHDVAIGSRYVAGGATAGWPLRRRLLSRCANVYARAVLGLATRDTTSGFRAWRLRALTEAGVLASRSNGYGFQVENTWRSERRGLRVAEHPILFTERTAGASKMDAAVAEEAALLVLRWRVTELVRRATLAVARSTDRVERSVAR